MNDNPCELFQRADFDDEYSIDTFKHEALDGVISLTFDANSSGQISKLSDFKNVENEAANRSKSPSNLEKIADLIINAVTIRGQQRFIDQDNQEDNISYEKSEKRLIVWGLSLAGLFSFSSLICIILLFQAFKVEDQNVYLAKTNVESTGNFPTPHVVFMNILKDGDMGYMLVFKQMNRSYFNYAWKFNVPDQSVSQTYFMFEDLGNIHVAYSNRKLKMTVIASTTLKHFTIPKSELRQEFGLGHSVRMGNFVMIFGGKNGFTNPSDPFDNEWPPVPPIQCSSVNEIHNKVTTQIWSIKRQVWIKGPYLPLKTGCVENACGVSINRTHGILFWAWEDVIYHKLHVQLQQCIDAAIFSLDTFEWVVVKKCIMFLSTNKIMKFTCSSYLNKSGKM